MVNKANNWWNTLSFEEQFYKVIEFAENCEHSHRMTLHDIEQVYNSFLACS